MFKNTKDKILSKASELATNARPMVIPMDDSLAGCKLAHQKTYSLYGTQYNCWVNDSTPRSVALQNVSVGDPIDFRPVPWEDGTMFLCIHRKTGLDIGVLINNVARKLQREYYGCYLVGTVEDLNGPHINIEVWQPPY